MLRLQSIAHSAAEVGFDLTEHQFTMCSLGAFPLPKMALFGTFLGGPRRRSSLARTTYVESPSILVPFFGTRALSWGASPSKVRDTWAMSASVIPSIDANATIAPSLTSEKIGRNGSSAGRNGTCIGPVGPPESQADLSLFIGCGIRQLSPHHNIRVFAEIITAPIPS